MSERKTIVSWDPQQAPRDLHSMLRSLGWEYPIVEGRRRGAVRVEFVPGGPEGAVEIARKGRQATVRYDKPARAARAVGTLLAGMVAPGETRAEQTPFTTFGIMLDCSRNAVITVERFEAWLRQLALLGYDTAMLYTEDTYALEGEDYFGYLRGRYSADELKRIDATASELGIEMIACIQTLGHMAQILRWPAYKQVRDTGSVLLADEEATYALIEKMIMHWASVYRSRRIHVGMDEAYDLARGRYLDRFGYRPAAEVFVRHLARVGEICRRHGLRPMIWSDMLFKLGGGDYDHDATIPEAVRAGIPADVQAVYWDYYHDDRELYLARIERHRKLGREPITATGVWTWHSLWYDRRRTETHVAPCVAACREAKVREFLATMWGDDGGVCEFDSALAGLAFTAECAYAGPNVSEGNLARRFAVICGSDYQAVRAASDLDLPSREALWDDPLLGILWKDRLLSDPAVWTKAVEGYAALLDRLKDVRRRTAPIDLAHAACLAEVLLAKVRLKLDLERAYAARDRAGLEAVHGQVPGVVRKIDAVLASFRRQWYARNKPQGFEAVQIRLGGQRQRYLELSQRLADLLAGRVASIPELDERPDKPGIGWTHCDVASGSVIL